VDAETRLLLRHRFRQDRRQSSETNDLHDGCDRIGFDRHVGLNAVAAHSAAASKPVMNSATARMIAREVCGLEIRP
jgi:hypothetical protein